MKTPKTVLTIESVPRVEIDFMNITHFEEIELVKKIGDYINDYQHTDKEREEITILLEQWLNHTQAHFHIENELMLTANFPAYSIHAHEHVVALDAMTNSISAWKANNDIELLADYIFVVWPQWFERHVNTMDVITAQYAVMHGVEPHVVIDKN